MWWHKFFSYIHDIQYVCAMLSSCRVLVLKEIYSSIALNAPENLRRYDSSHKVFWPTHKKKPKTNMAHHMHYPATFEKLLRPIFGNYYKFILFKIIRKILTGFQHKLLCKNVFDKIVSINFLTIPICVCICITKK